MISRRVAEGRPYPEHATSSRVWATIPPSQVSLGDLVTTKAQLQLNVLLDDDSTCYGDALFDVGGAHVVHWQGELYLEEGLHRALRCALHQRHVLHARVLRLEP